MNKSKIKTTLVVLLVAILSLTSITLTANAAIKSDQLLQNKQLLENAREVNKVLNELGYSDAATLAILANVNQESTFHPDAGGNQYGCMGMVQYCFERQKRFAAAVPDWQTNIRGQFEYIDKEMPQTQLLTWDTANHPRSSWVPEEWKRTYKSLDEFKNETEYKRALFNFVAFFEVPGDGRATLEPYVNARMELAEDMLNNWKELFGTEYGSNKGGKSGSKEGKDAKKEGVPSEFDLEGMPRFVNLADKADPIKLETKNSLSANDLMNVKKLDEARNIDQHTYKANVFGVTLGVMGILLMVWAVAIVITGLFDMANSVVPLHLCKKVSLGRIDIDAERENENGKPLWKVFKMSLFVFLLGVFVMAGGLFGMFEWIYWTFEGFWNKGK